MKTTVFKLFILLPLFSACQTANLRVVCSLPSAVKESSGLVVESPNRFWTHNDSGDKALLYQFDSTGVLRRTIVVKNASNIDWEDIAIDANKENFFIGDFGNNSQNRQDLAIYKISIPVSTTFFSTDTVTADKISFSYEDQRDFPPADSLKQFDAEAFIATTDSIYIFTKDFDSQPYQGKTRIYRLPKVLGTHTAKLVRILETDNSWKYNGAITGASLGSDGKLLLMSYQKLWAFTNYPNRQFWLGNRKELTFGLTQFAQREAVALAPWDNCTVYITSEETQNIGGNLSTFNICRILSKSKETSTSKTTLRIAPTPSVSDVTVAISGEVFDKSVLKVYNANGSEILQKKITQGETEISLASHTFPSAGFYFCKLFSAEGDPLSMEKILIIR
ncbi:MAG: T9SS type A sorting domain-containing protein [Saprospiraceae bacterium]|nr:T9SS type A sorting domain-containing protein [Saprospiraceae bacterium]